MKKLLYICLSITLSLSGQTNNKRTLSTPQSTGGEIVAAESITLAPGFSFASATGKSLNLKIDLATYDFGTSPVFDPNANKTLTISNDQNYILTRTFMQDDGKRFLDKIQYFDGLGRPNQAVQVAASSSGKDLVSLLEYDNFGRESKTWLPAVMTSEGKYISPSTVRTSVISSNGNDKKPFSHSVYENSPLNRVLENIGAGEAWGLFHEKDIVKTEYLKNSETIKELQCFLLEFEGGVYPGSGVNLYASYYYNNSLNVEKNTYSDKSIQYRFKDKKGYLLLIRNVINGIFSDTYFVLNTYETNGYVNNMRYSLIIPPEHSKTIQPGYAVFEDDKLSDLCYAFEIDYRTQECIALKPPNKPWQCSDLNTTYEYLVSTYTNRLLWNNGRPIDVVKTEYLKNSETIKELQCFQFYLEEGLYPESSIYLWCDNYYKNNSLDVEKNTYSDNSVQYRFSDKEGHLLLIRKIINGTPRETYFVLDPYSTDGYLENMKYSLIIPPEYAKTIRLGNYVFEDGKLPEFCYAFYIDASTQECIALKKPEMPWVYLNHDLDYNSKYESAISYLMNESNKSNLPRESVEISYLSNKTKVSTSLTVADSLGCGHIRHTAPLTYSYSQNYYSGHLYVTRTKDEDGNRSYEFKNTLGQIVLSRQVNGSQLLDTYYVYDDFGNLSAVFPPEASDLIYKEKAQLTGNSTARLSYAYLYKYDHRRRCTWKKLPGCEPIYYVYDKADQLIFSQDGEQRKKGEWAFSIPDAFGRTALTGVCKNTLIVGNQIEAVVKATLPTPVVTNTTMGYTVSGIALTTPLTITSANYYDNYNFLGYNDIPNSNDTKYVAETGYGTQYTNAKGMLTGSVVAQMNGSTTKLYSVMYYDNRGRLIQSKSNNHLTGGFEKEYIAYNFTGQPTKKLHVHSATGKTTQTELYAYTYDHAGRLLDTKHKWNNGAETLIASNTYDELGRLKTNKKGGNASLNTTYAYNIRSWTTSIMNNHLHFSLDYTHGGNIKSQSWRQSSKTRKYDFTYDNLSRLTAANYTSENTLEKYNTSYSYDKHGNMMTIQRGGLVSGITFNTVDNLALSYVGNQLNNVHDTGTKVNLSSSADFKDYSVDAAKTKKEYAYNANGAMTQDLNKGISTIQYNSLNLPTMMDIKSPVGEARNEYTYSASGQKLKVIQKWNPAFNTNPIIGSAINVSSLTTSLTTDYVGNKIYENGSLKRILVDGGYIEGGKYHYYLTDHLGNNRTVVEASGAIIQQTQYYPFGMAFAENVGMEKQPYKYNNKELDTKHGLNMYDYAARYLDNGVPRFSSVDPLAEKYYSWSPYVYAANNPLKYIDPTGMAYRYVYANEEEGEEGGYYVNDDGKRVEWDEVHSWLTASDDNLTDQNEEWGTLSIFANPGNGSFSSQAMGKGRFGHSWVKLESKEGGEMTFGTFKRGVARDGRAPGRTFQVNYEKDKLYEAFKHLSSDMPITNKQRLVFDMLNTLEKNTDWANGHNCTDYAVDMWNLVTGQNLYPTSGYRTPTELYNILKTMLVIPLPSSTKK